LKFRFKDDYYKYPKNVTWSTDMMDKDVERENDIAAEGLQQAIELSQERTKLLIKDYKEISERLNKPWWKFWQR